VPTLRLSSALGPRLRSGLFIAVASFFAWAVASAATSFAAAKDCPVDATQHASPAVVSDGYSCPDIGRMGSIKLAIPKHYILGPDFVYKGVDIWQPDSYKRQLLAGQSFDSEIRYFSIRIRLGDFRPVETQTDLDSFDESQNSPLSMHAVDRQWIFVQFNYPSSFSPSDVILKRYLDRNSNTPSIYQRVAPVNGYEHYITTVDPSVRSGIGGVNELFYNATDPSSVIRCTNSLMSVSPYTKLTNCDDLFVLKSHDVSVDIGNIQDKTYYLSNLDRIHSGIMALFGSFIVQ
jgi:hypothetical protein